MSSPALRELVVGVGVVAGLEERAALVEDGPCRRGVDVGVAGRLGRLELEERRLGVGVAGARAGGEVLLVERDRLLAAAAELAQRLGAREEDPGTVGELAGAREEGVGVPELAAFEGLSAEVEQLAGDLDGVLLLGQRLGDRGLGVGVGDAVRLQRRVGGLELLHRLGRDRAVDPVDGELGLDLVELVEAHLEVGDLRALRAGREPAGRLRRRCAGEHRDRGAVAGRALEPEHRVRRERARRREPERRRGVRPLGRDLLDGSVRHALAHRPTLPEAPDQVKGR